MPRLDRIVVGLDEGQLADAAIVTAAHLSRLLGTRLEVVHSVAVRAERPWLTDASLLQWIEAEAESEARKSRTHHLKELLYPLATSDPEIEQILHVTLGRPSAVLAERAGPDAIVVLGAHGHRGLLDFGNTTREMLNHLRGPLWVQNSRPWGEIRRILMPIDLMPGSTSVLSLARDLAVATGAEITALHCFEPIGLIQGDTAQLTEITERLKQSQREALRSFVATEGGEALRIVEQFETGNPAKTVLALAANYDLVVMGTHGHSALARAIVGSHAYRVLRAAETPVVVVPELPDRT